MTHELPIPTRFNPDRVGKVWRVDYQRVAELASVWAKEHDIQPASKDRFKTCLLLVDVQNTFCIPGFELYVGGRSGTGAVDDNRRLCEFIYRNLHRITHVISTMDTHQAMQIFHSVFLVNEKGEHPSPFTLISHDDVVKGRWQFNSDLSHSLGLSKSYLQRHLLHYTSELKKTGKYDLTIWPYHAMLGGVGHALVSAVEEAIFFHTIARYSQPDIHIKGSHTLTEHYSILGPEVAADPYGEPLAERGSKFSKKLIEYDAVLIAGQAKSHCVAWTVDDLLRDTMLYANGDNFRELAKKIYLIKDCTSPVVVPGIIDYTDSADSAFKRFADAGVHLVKSTDSAETWIR